MKIAITGGTGLVGLRLKEKLLSLGFHVLILSRSKRVSNTNGLSYAVWNVEKQEIDITAICSVDYIIHLAGANIAEARWTEKQQKRIINSRVEGSNLIFKTLKENKHNVTAFISASGADCYGVQTTTNVYKESDRFGNDFLAKVCEQWEQSANQFKELGIRTVCLRTGVVFAKQGSALQKMTIPIRLGVGSPIGSGNQVMSFIHIEDLCNLYIEAIQNSEISGAYNAVASNNTNKEVTIEIAKQLNKSVFLPNVPGFVLKMIFGKMACILLEGSNVDISKIKKTGFKFKFPTLQSVLKDVL